MIAIIGAMDQEIREIRSHMSSLEDHRIPGGTCHTGTLNGLSVVLVKTGVGKVLSAMATQYVIDTFSPVYVLFTGLAGAINPDYEIGDIILARDLVQYDMDVSQMGFKIGEIPFSGIRFIPSNAQLLEIASGCHEQDMSVKSGRIVTGDRFITETNTENTRFLTDELSGDAVEMEGASVAIVCHMNKMPFLVIRTISDRADHAAAVDFSRFLPQASKRSYRLVSFLMDGVKALDSGLQIQS